MPFDSSGVFNRVIPGGWKADAAAGIKIRADRHDDEDDGFAVGLSTCITKDGRTQPTANLPMNNKKLTNLGDPTDPGDGANRRYVDAKLGEVFTITGVDDAGRITFAGSQSPLATGEPLGISWTQADLFFGVKPLDVEVVGKLPRFVWNDKGDGMGTDVMSLTDTSVLTLAKKDDGASPGPVFDLKRESASPAANDTLGRITWSGKNSVAADVTYGQISITVNDATVNTTDATMGLAIPVAGTLTNRLVLAAAGATVDGALGVTGSATVNGNIGAGAAISAGTSLAAVNGNMVMGDGGTGRILQMNSGYYWDWNSSNGTLIWRTPAAARFDLQSNGEFLQYGANAYKSVAGQWASWSDARAKTVLGDYTRGLAEILQVQPRRFVMKDDPDRREQIGMVAQEVEGPFPETVSKREGEIGGKTLSDKRMFDPTTLLYACMNAIRELSAEVEALKEQLAGAPE